ncbi:MAG TPA: hypothetical protein VFY36_03955 [Solirubrobacteraceae bacterium]|nr:hypothetical protein [Solirubrobacteraceae bacterium]
MHELSPPSWMFGNQLEQFLLRGHDSVVGRRFLVCGIFGVEVAPKLLAEMVGEDLTQRNRSPARFEWSMGIHDEFCNLQFEIRLRLPFLESQCVFRIPPLNIEVCTERYERRDDRHHDSESCPECVPRLSLFDRHTTFFQINLTLLQLVLTHGELQILRTILSGAAPSFADKSSWRKVLATQPRPTLVQPNV